MRSKVILIAAIILGVITTLLFYNYMKQFDAESIANETLMEVVAAKQEINKNQRVTSDMLEMVKIPEAALHPSTVTHFQDIVGMFATSHIEEGETLLTHRFQSEKEEQLFVSRKVTEGYRAVSIGQNFVQSVSNLIEPEDIVDVVLTLDGENEEGGKYISYILLEEVRVLAVGRRLLDQDSGQAYVEYSSVTLELLPEDSVKLINGSENGILQLILHSRVDRAEEE